MIALLKWLQVHSWTYIIFRRLLAVPKQVKWYWCFISIERSLLQSCLENSLKLLLLLRIPTIFRVLSELQNRSQTGPGCIFKRIANKQLEAKNNFPKHHEMEITGWKHLPQIISLTYRISFEPGKNEERRQRGKVGRNRELCLSIMWPNQWNSFKTARSRLVLCNVAQIWLTIVLLNYLCDKSSLISATGWYPSGATKHQEAGKSVNTLFSWRHIKVDDWLCEAAYWSERLNG